MPKRAFQYFNKTLRSAFFKGTIVKVPSKAEILNHDFMPYKITCLLA